MTWAVFFLSVSLHLRIYAIFILSLHFFIDFLCVTCKILIYLLINWNTKSKRVKIVVIFHLACICQEKKLWLWALAVGRCDETSIATVKSMAAAMYAFACLVDLFFVFIFAWLNLISSRKDLFFFLNESKFWHNVFIYKNVGFDLASVFLFEGILLDFCLCYMPRFFDVNFHTQFNSKNP